MLAVPPTPRDRDIPVDRVARAEGTSPLNSRHEKMAQDNRSDLARLERMERRLQALEYLVGTPKGRLTRLERIRGWHRRDDAPLNFAWCFKAINSRIDPAAPRG